MTWYRVGPAGIPGSLKTDMDAVLNKKFGTSTTYAPNTWPDNVNLLGPLPEKTANGAIAHIEDGADEVPTKSLVVTIPPTLDGVSSVTETQTGKNLLDTSAFDSLEYYTVNANGSITVNSSDSRSWSNVPALIFLKAGTYTLSRSLTGSQCYIRASLDNYASNVCSLGNTATEKNFTLSEDAYIKVKVGYNGTYPFTDSYLLEVGSTASSYEPYTEPTQYTASLGRTIYGGTADIVNGVGQATFALHKVTSNDGIYDYSTGNGFRVSTSTWVEGIMKGESNNGGICNEFDTVTNNNSRGVRFSIGDNTSIYFVQVYSEIGNTVEDFKNWLDNHDVYVVYPLATPTDFTFTGQEIPTRLGVNNFWADEGDSDVTYRADISLALQALGGGGRGLMMMQRPEEEQLTETEEDPEEQPEEAETNER